MKTIKLLYRWCKKQNKKLEKKRKNENENQRQTKLIIICGNNKVLYETCLLYTSLLSKQRRDTRMNYVNRNDNEFSKEKSQVDAPFYRQYPVSYTHLDVYKRQHEALCKTFRWTKEAM